MSESNPLEEMAAQASQKGKDPKLRRWVYILLALCIITWTAFAGFAWNAYFNKKAEAQSLAEQITFACVSGDFGPGVSKAYEDTLCSNAQHVIDNQGEIQEGEIQEPEIQDPEIQDQEFQESEIQNPENQQPERQTPEYQQLETQEFEIQDPEIQDEETQDPEIQDPENQDPEVDDPDPNDQIQSGSCTFDGRGTITLTFETTSGPVTFECTGTDEPPGQEGILIP